MYVEVKNLQKRFGRYPAVNDVSFGIPKGKLIGLLGPSGSGKTTILRAIAGLEAPDSGDIYVNGLRINDVDPGKREIGFVFQNYALFRHMTVYDNIAFGLRVKKWHKDQIDARVGELIGLIGLEGLEKRYPHQLSGGQRQRVAFARAIATGPQLLLLDEPFAAIDAKVRRELRTWLKEIIGKLQITSIFVTHDQNEAIEIADEIYILNLGKLEQSGSPIDIYQNPQTSFVANFIGESTIIEEYGRLGAFAAEPPGRKGLIRPEYVEVYKKAEAEDTACMDAGTIVNVLFRGNQWELAVDVNGVTIPAYRSLERDELTVGDRVSVLVHRIYFFDDSGAWVVENEWEGGYVGQPA